MIYQNRPQTNSLKEFARTENFRMVFHNFCC